MSGKRTKTVKSSKQTVGFFEPPPTLPSKTFKPITAAAAEGTVAIVRPHPKKATVASGNTSVANLVEGFGKLGHRKRTRRRRRRRRA